MNNIDDMPFDDLLKLFEQKNYLIKNGNLPALLDLKKLYPDLFLEKKEKELTKLISDIDTIMVMPHIKEKMLEDKKRRLIPVDLDQWKIGMLHEVLQRYETIYFSSIHDVSRALVKESLIICKQGCEQENGENKIDFFPLIGLLINEILNKAPKEKRARHLEGSVFKLRGRKSDDIKPIIIKENNRFYNSKDVIQIKNRLQHLLKETMFKFDSRKGFYTDLIFFCLIEVSDFIGILMPAFGYADATKKDMITNQILRYISI